MKKGQWYYVSFPKPVPDRNGNTQQSFQISEKRNDGTYMNTNCYAYFASELKKGDKVIIEEILNITHSDFIGRDQMKHYSVTANVKIRFAEDPPNNNSFKDQEGVLPYDI
jgi:hypothetical protein